MAVYQIPVLNVKNIAVGDESSSKSKFTLRTFNLKNRKTAVQVQDVNHFGTPIANNLTNSVKHVYKKFL